MKRKRAKRGWIAGVGLLVILVSLGLLIRFGRSVGTEQMDSTRNSVSVVGTQEVTTTTEEQETAATEIVQTVQESESVVDAQEVVSAVRTQELWAQRDEWKIYGVAYVPEILGREKFPTVILAHGFGGSHRSLEDYAQLLAQHGYAAYVFDFVGGGNDIQSDGTMLDMSLLTEKEDLKAVVELIRQQSFVDTDNLFLAGASQGGAVVAITAPEIADEIQGLLLFYPGFVLVDDAKDAFASVDEVPETYTILGRQVSRKYAVDVLNMDIYQEIAGYDKEVLILHGDQDGIVPIRYSEKALDVYEKAELKVIPEAGHGFRDGDRETAKGYVLEYLEKQRR